MLKIRVTYEGEKKEEVNKLINDLEKIGYDILNQSKVYKGRGVSKYNNIYIWILKKKINVTRMKRALWVMKMTEN